MRYRAGRQHTARWCAGCGSSASPSLQLVEPLGLFKTLATLVSCLAIKRMRLLPLEKPKMKARTFSGLQSLRGVSFWQTDKSSIAVLFQCLRGLCITTQIISGECNELSRFKEILLYSCTDVRIFATLKNKPETPSLLFKCY